jgi:hypothetical protein
VIDRFSKLPDIAKMGVAAAAGLAGLALLSVGLGLAGKLLNPSPQAGEPISMPSSLIEPVDPKAEPKASAETDSQRYQLWTELQASTGSLQQSIADFEGRMRVARGQRWYQRSIIECQKMTPANCPSPYLWLVYQYQQQVFDLRQKLISGKVGTDGASTDAIRAQLATLQDIAAALTSTEGSPPQPAIAVADLSDKATEVYSKAASFEALRQQEANQTYQQRGSSDAQ